MGANSKIEWTHHTFNPWWGCTKVSPACDNCYAEALAERVGFSETGSQFPIWGKDAERRFFGDRHWEEPLAWNRMGEQAGERRRVFCGSMCDVMEGDRPTLPLAETRAKLYKLIEQTPWLDWLLLTKRPQFFRHFLPVEWLDRPRPNVWGMTTVESAEYLWRVTELLNTPFAVRGLSMEPLLGPVDLTSVPCKDRPSITRNTLTGQFANVPFATSLGTRIMVAVDTKPRIDWVIAGGESGPGARPTEEAWVTSLRDQCVEAGVAFHFKQWGDWLPAMTDGAVIEGKAQTINCSDEPQRVGKKAAGRLLDGRMWDELPRAVAV